MLEAVEIPANPRDENASPNGIAATRLSELLGRVSLAVDAANGARPGAAVCATVVALELGARVGATSVELRETYWTSLLSHFGASDALTGESGRSMVDRLRTLDRDPPFAGAARTPAPPGSSMATLLCRLSQVLVTGTHIGDRCLALEMACDVAQDGEHSELRRVLQGDSDVLFHVIDDPEIFARFLDAEGTSPEWLDPNSLDAIAASVATLVERRIPFFRGHAGRVARLAESAAHELGLSSQEVTTLRVAAWLHDIGRVSVPNTVWERSGALDWGSWERVRLHPYYTDRVLSPIASLRAVADIATAAHERIDGSGYPQRRAARSLPLTARVLAAADVAVAMSESRPYRVPATASAIAEELVSEASSGRLDGRAVDAVLAALGLAERTLPSSHGLSDREFDVARLLARGKSDKEIAAALRISPRTVQIHVARILDKLGVRGRANAAIWLIERDLIC